jgi:amidophosphoribosyltransferase
MGKSTHKLDAFLDHCGVVGIWGHDESSKLAYLALYALQHRGQDSAGIVSLANEKFRRHVALGIVADVFDEDILASYLAGSAAIGHVRYTTAGTNGLQDAQPLLAKTFKGHVALAHNGNLVNADLLKEDLEKEGAIFHSSADTEVICHLLAKSQAETIEQRLVESLAQIRGAYALCVLSKEGLIGVRDPSGVRPLVIGKLEQGYVLASEDCAFELIEAKRIREIEPGEMVVINEKGITSMSIKNEEKLPKAQCIFEHVYFSRPDSRVFDISVYASRMSMGKQLAKEHPADADVVIAVPDSGVVAAMGYAKASGLPFEMGLVRNHYVGRTFIEPENRIRDFGVRLKLSPIKEVVKGRRLVVVDDSVVRGTTSRKIVKMLRFAGATEIHLRVSAPPTLHPCFYGINTPCFSELIAATHTREEIVKHLEVDSLGYLSVSGLHSALFQAEGQQKNGVCDACFTGNYPIPLNQIKSTKQTKRGGQA